MVLGQALTYLVMPSSNIASQLNNMVIAMFEGLLWLTKLEEKKNSFVLAVSQYFISCNFP